MFFLSPYLYLTCFLFSSIKIESNFGAKHINAIKRYIMLTKADILLQVIIKLILTFQRMMFLIGLNQMAMILYPLQENPSVIVRLLFILTWLTGNFKITSEYYCLTILMAYGLLN
ncbi:unnamed protein product [Timema podura]|uniref:Uncharacterized protein n=1 Tax=Timema podura TaxID=61482 RepID=A0ABN7NWB7_TIMPD|nr:unnamed protein product [Timema podura]